MTLVDWLAFGVLVVSTGTGAVILGLRAFDAWRAFRSLRRTVGRGLGDLTGRVTGVERRLAHLGDNAAKLDDAQKRLQRSLSTAAVLADAAGDARSALGRIRALVPRK
jgi:hypothetical protein